MKKIVANIILGELLAFVFVFAGLTMHKWLFNDSRASLFAINPYTLAITIAFFVLVQWGAFVTVKNKLRDLKETKLKS